MEECFQRPANQNPETISPNTHTVKMKWVLQFERAKQVYDAMLAERVWVNEKDRNAVIRFIRKQGLLPPFTGSVRAFGKLDQFEHACPVPEVMMALYGKHTQHRKVNQHFIKAPMDDLTAALANFAFHVLVQGEVRCLERPASGLRRFRVSLSRIGVYVRDSYDFNDESGWTSQPLGFWNPDTRYGGKSPVNSYYVNNKSFRDWRTFYGNGRGGDYLIFSDIQVHSTHNTFEFNA